MKTEATWASNPESPLATTNASENSRLYTLILIGIMAAGALLRLYQLNAGLWLDEILTYRDYARLPFAQIVTTFDSENQHFLYSLLAHASFLLFGESAWALRLPAVLFGVASIWAVYRFGLEVSTSVEALLAAALLAFSYHHVWFSQNGRGYTGLLFWTTLSSWLLVRGLKTGRWPVWAGFAISAALGVYTHLTMLFVVAGQMATVLLSLILRRSAAGQRHFSFTADRASLLKVLGGFVGAGLLTLLLYAPVIPQVLGTVGGSEASVVSEWKSPLWTALEILRGLQVGFAGAIFGGGALVLFGAGLWSYFRSEPLVVGLLLIPPVLGAAVVIAIGHHLWPRFFFFAMGLAALVLIRGVLVVAEGLASLVRLKYARQIAVGFCAGLVLLSAVSALFAFGPKQDYEGARAFIEANRQPGDAVVTASLAGDIYTSFYQTGWTKVTSTAELQAIRQQAGRTWLLYTFQPVLAEMYPDVWEVIEREFRVVRNFHGTVNEGAIVILLDKASSASLLGAEGH